MEHTTDIKNEVTDTATRLGEGANGVVEDLQNRANDAWDVVQDRTGRAVRESSAYVRENPLPVTLAAVGFGLILALLLSHREQPSFRDRYIEEPLHKSRGVLLALLVACGALLKGAYSSASSAAEELAGNVGAELKGSLKPLKKAARQTGRKFGL